MTTRVQGARRIIASIQTSWIRTAERTRREWRIVKSSRFRTRGMKRC